MRYDVVYSNSIACMIRHSIRVEVAWRVCTSGELVPDPEGLLETQPIPEEQVLQLEILHRLQGYWQEQTAQPQVQASEG